MFIFNASVLSVTWPNFFSRAIIEPWVQTPLPATPAEYQMAVTILVMGTSKN